MHSCHVNGSNTYVASECMKVRFIFVEVKVFIEFMIPHDFSFFLQVRVIMTYLQIEYFEEKAIR